MTPRGTSTDQVVNHKHMGYENVTLDIREDSITCRDNTENMGYVFVIHDIEENSDALVVTK